ncbi:MAG TPA: Type 1 glutamine amidotransferase-like domain-containing protein [Mycobacteriales bacterium]|nr:Type 1 glutamine amidotransferase-like domain-containing protein [Mycobacteriales bacterium]
MTAGAPSPPVGLICLQGGGEFSPGCRPMDVRVVRRVAGGAAAGAAPVRVVVVALAGAEGREHDTAAARGVAHYARLGADAVAAPDARTDPDGAAEAMSDAQLLILAGGSPSRLIEALHATPVGGVLVDLVRRGVAVSGASAGAMVLCAWAVLPDRRGEHGPAVVRGLGLVPGALVVPHWSGGSSRGDWLRAVSATVAEPLRVLGLPEESGVLVEGPRLTALGRSASCEVGSGQELLPGSTLALGVDR